MTTAAVLHNLALIGCTFAWIALQTGAMVLIARATHKPAKTPDEPVGVGRNPA